MVNFETVTEFEKQIAAFFGAPYGVATDSCTSAIELCLRYKWATSIHCPTNTYISVPMLANKLGIELQWLNAKWTKLYFVHDMVVDAATYWQANGYKECLRWERKPFMCLSFQYQKHLSLGRGGMILCDNKQDAETLRKMAYDGRERNIPWREQDIDIIGYHYYMLPETAAEGLRKLPEAIVTAPRIWTSEDYPDVSKFKVFNK